MHEAVIQRDTNGIKALDFGEIEVEKFLPTSILIKTSMVPLLPYDVMKLNGKIPVTLPHVLGYGAVGEMKGRQISLGKTYKSTCFGT